MQVTVECKGDSVGGDGRKNVVLRMSPPQQGGIGSANDDWRFSVDALDPAFPAFVHGNTYTVDINPA